MDAAADSRDFSNTLSNEKHYRERIREKFHKLFLREKRRFVKYPTAQSRVGNFFERFFESEN